MKAEWKKYTLIFDKPAGTSRGVMHTRDVWYIILSADGLTGIGECAPLPGLSIDNADEFENSLTGVCEYLAKNEPAPIELIHRYPALRFGVEMAIRDIETGGKRLLFDTAFTRGKEPLPINGLIWMGSFDDMKNQIDEKVNNGFKIIKIKIGAIRFDLEVKLLAYIRETYGHDIELRLDANGAFSYTEAKDKLRELSQYNIHSIEQPIQAGQLHKMASLCEESPIPIALDEELIPWQKRQEKKELLMDIHPQYIIIKPTLVGGFTGSQEWIDQADDLGIGWWVTSALESNIGLNAIAQWTATFNVSIPHGLGTGMLFSNNIQSPLEVQNGTVRYNVEREWGHLI